MGRNNSNLSFMIPKKYNLPKSRIIVANKKKQDKTNKKTKHPLPKKAKTKKQNQNQKQNQKCCCDSLWIHRESWSESHTHSYISINSHMTHAGHFRALSNWHKGKKKLNWSKNKTHTPKTPPHPPLSPPAEGKSQKWNKTIMFRLKASNRSELCELTW